LRHRTAYLGIWKEERIMLTRQQVVQGTLDEWELFATLVSGLDEAQWAAPSRCEGWQVRDVAAHVYGTAHDVLKGTVGQRTPDEEAQAHRHLSPRELAAELRQVVAGLDPLFASLDDAAWASPSPAPDFSIGEGVLALWYDTWIHGDDIRAAVGLPTVRGGGLVAAVAHVHEQLGRREWGPARLALQGLPELSVGEANGKVVAADPFRFVMVATGRADAAELGLEPSVNIYA
jgi:uncharacterized protein (TIGR03083 family)